MQAKNKQPAPMQITAEQILREARERQEDDAFQAPAQKITDPEVQPLRVSRMPVPLVSNSCMLRQELAVYRLRQRKYFEDRLRMNRNAMGTWLKYSAFEEAQACPASAAVCNMTLILTPRATAGAS